MPLRTIKTPLHAIATVDKEAAPRKVTRREQSFDGDGAPHKVRIPRGTEPRTPDVIMLVAMASSDVLNRM